MKLIQVSNLSKKFRTFCGDVQALSDVSLVIPEGSCTVIGGENGSGKSVLVSILAGLESADSGEVRFEFEGTGRSGRDGVCRKSGKFDASQNPVGLVFQEAETQILGETPREDIAFGLKNLGMKKGEIENAVSEALEKTGLTQKADFPARFLSGGEKRRLAVACMVAMGKPVIILDEPYANLDFTGVKQVNALVRALKNEGKTVVILTHEIEKCLALSDRFIVLFRGSKVYDGTPAEALSMPLEEWNIRNPIFAYKSLEDLVWE